MLLRLKDPKKEAADFKSVHLAETVEAAQDMLLEFEAKWDGKYPTIGQSRRRNRELVIPFLSHFRKFAR